MAIVFALTTIFCGAGWLLYKMMLTALLWYMLDKNCPEPTKEEWERYFRDTILETIKDLF